MTQTDAEKVRALATAQIEGELAALAAARNRAATRPRRAQRGESIVYTLRLDVSDVAALERRAALLGLPPTVLARNLLRIGLGDNSRPTLGAAIEQVESVLSGLRALAAEPASPSH